MFGFFFFFFWLVGWVGFCCCFTTVVSQTDHRIFIYKRKWWKKIICSVELLSNFCFLLFFKRILEFFSQASLFVKTVCYSSVFGVVFFFFFFKWVNQRKYGMLTSQSSLEVKQKKQLSLAVGRLARGLLKKKKKDKPSILYIPH